MAVLTNFAINGTLLDANPATVSCKQANSQLLAYGDQIIVAYTSLSAGVLSMLVSGYSTAASATLHIQTNGRWITNVPITLLAEGGGAILIMTILRDTCLVTPLYPAQFY